MSPKSDAHEVSSLGRSAGDCGSAVLQVPQGPLSARRRPAVALFAVGTLAWLVGAPTRAPLIAQLTVDGEGTYAQGLYGGPCETSDSRQGRAPGIGEQWTIRNVITRYHFPPVVSFLPVGAEVGQVSPPECRPVWLPPGDYVRRVLGYENTFELICSWGDPADCTQTGIRRIADENIDESVSFTVSERCRPPLVGEISYMKGEAFDGNGTPLARGDRVRPGEEIRTGPGTKLEFSSPGIRVRLGPDSHFTNSVHTCTPERPWTVPRVLGTIWVEVFGGSWEVELGDMGGGTRGTTFEMRTIDGEDGDPRGSLLRVHEGEVEAWNLARPEERVMVAAGHTTRVVGDAPPSEPEPFTPDDTWAELEAATEGS